MLCIVMRDEGPQNAVFVGRKVDILLRAISFREGIVHRLSELGSHATAI